MVGLHNKGYDIPLLKKKERKNLERSLKIAELNEDIGVVLEISNRFYEDAFANYMNTVQGLRTDRFFVFDAVGRENLRENILNYKKQMKIWAEYSTCVRRYC